MFFISWNKPKNNVKRNKYIQDILYDAANKGTPKAMGGEMW